MLPNLLQKCFMVSYCIGLHKNKHSDWTTAHNYHINSPALAKHNCKTRLAVACRKRQGGAVIADGAETRVRSVGGENEPRMSKPQEFLTIFKCEQAALTKRHLNSSAFLRGFHSWALTLFTSQSEAKKTTNNSFSRSFFSMGQFVQELKSAHQTQIYRNVIKEKETTCGLH